MVALNTAYAPSKTRTQPNAARQRGDGEPQASPKDGLKRVPEIGQFEPQNRVGNFFGGVGDRAGKNRLSTRKGIGENGPTLTIIASGRPVWPNRDPIGENWRTGEFNGYAFVRNQTPNYIDVLGRWMDPGTSGTGNQWWSHDQPTGPQSLDDITPRFLKKTPNLPAFSVNLSAGAEGKICAPTGLPPWWGCVSVSITVKTGQCCKKDGSEGEMGEITGSIGAEFAFGIQKPGSISPKLAGNITGLPNCPTKTSPEVNGEIEVKATYGVGVASCAYDIKKGMWSCGGEVAYGEGVSLSAGGSIKVTGKYLIK